MTPRQEFLIIESDDDVAVYTPSTFPIGTPILPDARRLGVDGPSLVRPPKTHLTASEFDGWQRQLVESGYAVTLGPFWTNPVTPETLEEVLRHGTFIPLKDAFDELLRESEGRSQAE